MKREMCVCVSVAALSLVTAAVFHRFLPGLGPAFKPLLWPLALLAFSVRTRYAAATAFLVPYLSYLVNGMPSLTTAVALSAVAPCAVIVLRCAFRLVRCRVQEA